MLVDKAVIKMMRKQKRNVGFIKIKHYATVYSWR